LNFALASLCSQTETANQADTATASPSKAAATIAKAWLAGRHFLLYSDRSGIGHALLGSEGALLQLKIAETAGIRCRVVGVSLFLWLGRNAIN
jgi:hypothetical protein